MHTLSTSIFVLSALFTVSYATSSAAHAPSNTVLPFHEKELQHVSAVSIHSNATTSSTPTPSPPAASKRGNDQHTTVSTSTQAPMVPTANDIGPTTPSTTSISTPTSSSTSHTRILPKTDKVDIASAFLDSVEGASRIPDPKPSAATSPTISRETRPFGDTIASIANKSLPSITGAAGGVATAVQNRVSGDGTTHQLAMPSPTQEPGLALQTGAAVRLRVLPWL